MLHVKVIYKPGIDFTMDINYHLVTDPFKDIIDETVKNFNNDAISSEQIISTLANKLNAFNQSIADLPSITPIDQTIINALQQLPTAAHNRPFVVQTVAKILMQCEVYGIDRLQFSPHHAQSNPQKLDEISYPENLVPEEYLCKIQSVIMTTPVKQTGLGLVDIAAIAVHAYRQKTIHHQQPKDMVTGQPLPNSFEINQAMHAAINLFIKKVQLTHYLFQQNDDYKTLYTQEAIQSTLQNEALSYDDFRQQLMEIHRIKSESTQSLSFFQPSENKTVYPPMAICDLFAKYKIHTLAPSKTDYELLIRRIAATGADLELETLLTHPVLDTITVDIDAQSSNGLTALGWINQNAEKFPKKTQAFEECRRILSKYKESHSLRATFGL